MKIIDISWPISEATTGYKDRHIVKLQEIKSFAKDGVRESKIQMSAHTGTHVDAPSHFLRDGKTIDQIPLDRVIGRCKVLDLTNVAEHITRDRLAEHDNDIAENDIVLLKTSNSSISPTDKFNPHFVYLQDSGAVYLTEKKIKAVGIDYLGLEHSQPDHISHTTLMHANISIFEGLRLKHVDPGIYLLVCLPLNIIGMEAAPARAVLLSGL